jgi:hypothetical protein
MSRDKDPMPKIDNKPPTARQLAFARRLVEGKTQSEAYRELYQPKAIDRTAAECGSKVARNPKVKAEVARLRALGNVKTILSLNDRLGLLAKIAQTAPRQSDSVRAIEVYSKISGDQAPERTITEHTGKDGAPIQQEVAVSGVVQVVRLSVRDKMRLLREARERDKASHDRA